MEQEKQIEKNIQKKDIFDKIMALPGLNIFENIYYKYKEVLLYLFFFNRRKITFSFTVNVKEKVIFLFLINLKGY